MDYDWDTLRVGNAEINSSQNFFRRLFQQKVFLYFNSIHFIGVRHSLHEKVGCKVKGKDLDISNVSIYQTLHFFSRCSDYQQGEWERRQKSFRRCENFMLIYLTQIGFVLSWNWFFIVLFLRHQSKASPALKCWQGKCSGQRSSSNYGGVTCH